MLSGLAILSGCVTSPTFTPDPALLVPWSEERQQRFPAPPYVARYERRGRSLAYVAALHEHRLGCATFRLIESLFDRFRPEVVIIEGIETEHGMSPAFFIDAVESPLQEDCSSRQGRSLEDDRALKGDRSQEEDLWPLGEPGYTASVALARGVPFIGGEPTDSEIRDAVVEGTIEDRDLLYYYLTRQIPQWKRTGEDQARSFEILFAECIDRDMKRLGLDDMAPADSNHFTAWYEERNGRPFSYEEITTQHTAPIEGESALFTNKMSLRIGEVRDTHIVRLIADLLERHDRVLIVYGAGHHVQQEKVLERMLGAFRIEHDLDFRVP